MGGEEGRKNGKEGQEGRRSRKQGRKGKGEGRKETEELRIGKEQCSAVWRMMEVAPCLWRAFYPPNKENPKFFLWVYEERKEGRKEVDDGRKEGHAGRKDRKWDRSHEIYIRTGTL